MSNGIITVHLTNLSIFHGDITECRKLKNHELGVVSNDIMSIQNFMEIHAVIFSVLLKNESRLIKSLVHVCVSLRLRVCGVCVCVCGVCVCVCVSL
jgi:hypothetical protein